ncbi:hypothetical protein DOJK_01975 [Patescibacteria group bacterium]|nr:hypothetical protein DOJK_01975 [Patescibacteria group bacterium]
MKTNLNTRYLSPQQKKHYSYQKDRRNCYGENAKSSRKNIPKSKQREHQAERRVAAKLLRQLPYHDDTVEQTLDKFKDQVKAKQLKRFKKCADLPLGKRLEQRAHRKALQFNRLL